MGTRYRNLTLATVVAAAALLSAACSPTAVTPVASTAPVAGTSTPGPTPPATLRTERLDRTGVLGATAGVRCDYDLTWVQVTGPGRDLAAMNHALDLTPEPAECAEPGESESGGYTGTALNRDGVLSLRYTVLTVVPGTAHPVSDRLTYAFDLRTGTPIALADLLTADGLRTMLDRCAAGLNARLDSPDPLVRGYCSDALTGSEPAFTITEKGLVAEPYEALPHVTQGIAEDGVLVTWAELGRGLRTGTVVAPFAGR